MSFIILWLDQCLIIFDGFMSDQSACSPPFSGLSSAQKQWHVKTINAGNMGFKSKITHSLSGLKIYAFAYVWSGDANFFKNGKNIPMSSSAFTAVFTSMDSALAENSLE